MHSFTVAEKIITVNISFREDLLNEIDEVARSESRSRSELLREVARLYIDRKKRMRSIIESMRKIASEHGITEADVEAEIAAHRVEKKAGR